MRNEGGAEHPAGTGGCCPAAGRGLGWGWGGSGRRQPSSAGPPLPALARGRRVEHPWPRGSLHLPQALAAWVVPCEQAEGVQGRCWPWKRSPPCCELPKQGRDLPTARGRRSAPLEPFHNKRQLCWGKHPTFNHPERFVERPSRKGLVSASPAHPGPLSRCCLQGQGLFQDWDVGGQSSSQELLPLGSWARGGDGRRVLGSGDAPAAPWQLHVWFVPVLKGSGWVLGVCSTPGGCGSCCLPQLGAAGLGPVVPTGLPQGPSPPATDSGSWFGEKWNEFGGFRSAVAQRCHVDVTK